MASLSATCAGYLGYLFYKSGLMMTTTANFSSQFVNREPSYFLLVSRFSKTDGPRSQLRLGCLEESGFACVSGASIR